MRENYIKSEAEEKEIKKGSKEEILEGLLQTAKNMLEANMSIETISKLTGLSVKKLKICCYNNKQSFFIVLFINLLYN